MGKKKKPAKRDAAPAIQSKPAGASLAIERWEWGTLLFMAAFVFVFQGWHLLEAGAPYSDEGTYAEAGRFLWQGLTPHRDFLLFHMPLLPWLLGLALKLTGGLYPARFLYLAVNCLSVLPLYWFVRALLPSRAAALTAAFFYLAYHEMTHHDFRWFAIRPIANTLLLLYAYLGSRPDRSRWHFLGQCLLCALSALLFVPALVDLGFLSLAFIFHESDLVRRRELWKRSLAIGLVGAVCVLGYWLLFPGAYSQIIVAQAQRARVPVDLRFQQMFVPVDRFFYSLALLSWLGGLVFLPRLRPFTLAMLAIWALNVFAPSNFYPHYAVIVAPAFCFGAFLFVAQGEALLGSRAGVWLGAAIALFQLQAVGSSLGKEMLGNIYPEHHALIEALRHAPGPLLTVQADYAVESGQSIVEPLVELSLRPPFPQSPFGTAEFWLNAAKQSGSILLEQRTLFYLNQAPPSVLEAWSSYEVVLSNKAGTLLLPRH